MEMSKKERVKRSFIIIIIMVIACLSIISSRERRLRRNREKENNVEIVGNYDIDIIKLANNDAKNTNYLISPYNIEIALNMLREGAVDKTKEEFDKVLGNRKINNVFIKDKLNVANAIFIRDKYKENVKKDYLNVLDKNYQTEVLYDKFENPDVINNWVKNKTNGMIDKILDQISNDYVLGLASAIALDIEWNNAFDCGVTKSEEFINNNKKINVEMMHKTFENEAKYLKTDDMEGIIIPYKKEKDSDIELEFVGIIPNSSIDDYINNLTTDKLSSIFSNPLLATNKYHINLSLPRFTYNYEIKDFIGILKKMGINLAFDKELANFKNMIDIEENIYVGEAIHKTRIELNEKGTKAAAVTYFGMKATGLIEQDYEEVNVIFNKPFIYMIREKNSGEILFFGTVYEPNKWNGLTCQND